MILDDKDPIVIRAVELHGSFEGGPYVADDIERIVKVLRALIAATQEECAAEVRQVKEAFEAFYHAALAEPEGIDLAHRLTERAVELRKNADLFPKGEAP